MITYKEQFDKLTRAYMEDKVRPYASCACFIGNLLNGNIGWSAVRRFQRFGQSTIQPMRSFVFPIGLTAILKESRGTYNPHHIVFMENLFLKTLEENTVGEMKNIGEEQRVCTHPNYEEALFKAFSVTLDALRGIHEDLGEKVDDFTFTKRQLQIV